MRPWPSRRRSVHQRQHCQPAADPEGSAGGEAGGAGHPPAAPVPDGAAGADDGLRRHNRCGNCEQGQAGRGKGGGGGGGGYSGIEVDGVGTEAAGNLHRRKARQLCKSSGQSC